MQPRAWTREVSHWIEADAQRDGHARGFLKGNAAKLSRCRRIQTPIKRCLRQRHGLRRQALCAVPTLEGEPASWPNAGETLPSSAMMPAPLSSSLRCLRRAAVGGLIVSLVSATTAEAGGMIRDAETESLIRTYAKPILTAAGLSGQGIDNHIV